MKNRQNVIDNEGGISLHRSLAWEVTTETLRRLKNYLLTDLVIELVSMAGLRVEELRGIKKCDIKWDSNTILIQRGKANYGRYVHIPTELAEKLKCYLSLCDICESPYLFSNNWGKPKSKTWVENIFRKFSHEFGFKVTPRTLRRSFIIRLVKKSMPPPYLQNWTRCNQLNMMNHYMTSVESPLKEIDEKMDDKLK